MQNSTFNTHPIRSWIVVFFFLVIYVGLALLFTWSMTHPTYQKELAPQPVYTQPL